MTSQLLNAFLALGAPPGGSGTAPDPKAAMLQQVGLLVFMGVVFYFLLIRPQRVRSKQQDSLLKNLKSNDRVVTSSGTLGGYGGGLDIKDKLLKLEGVTDFRHEKGGPQGPPLFEY